MERIEVGQEICISPLGDKGMESCRAELESIYYLFVLGHIVYLFGTYLRFLITK